MAKRKKKRMDPKMVRAIAEDLGWDFSKGFYQQNTLSKAGELAALAKVYGYRKPKNGTGSTAWYFFRYLNKKK